MEQPAPDVVSVKSVVKSESVKSVVKSESAKSVAPPLPAGLDPALFEEFKRRVDKRLEVDNELIIDLQMQLKMLKQMGAPKDGDGGGGAGMLDALQDMIDALRKEMNDKIGGLREDTDRRVGDVNVFIKELRVEFDGSLEDITALR